MDEGGKGQSLMIIALLRMRIYTTVGSKHSSLKCVNCSIVFGREPKSHTKYHVCTPLK